MAPAALARITIDSQTTMRFLHVLDTLEAGGSGRALIALLAAIEASPRQGFHDVLSLAGGELQATLGTRAHRVTVAPVRLEVAAAVLTGDYDVVHVLDRRAARMLAPMLAASAAAAFAYSAPALNPRSGALPLPPDAAEQALLAACDLAFVAPDTTDDTGDDAALDGTDPRIVRLDLRPLAGEGGEVWTSSREAVFRMGAAREWWAALQCASAVPTNGIASVQP